MLFFRGNSWLVIERVEYNRNLRERSPTSAIPALNESGTPQRRVREDGRGVPMPATESTGLREGSASRHRTAGGQPVNYEYTPVLPEILGHLKAALLVSTYQAGKLLVIGVHHGRLCVSYLDFDQPMGVAARPDRVAIGSRSQVHFFQANRGAAAAVEPRGTFDGCYVARTSLHTGRILGHDLGWGQEGLWVVNTLFSCLCTLDESYSFVPRWRPAFISRLADEDRCHLNGLAIESGVPRYVTALAETDTASGWRADKAKTGCVIDVSQGGILARGFAMPHSPRIHDGRLWLLDSGTGSIGVVDRTDGKYEVVDRVPGYSRGLGFCGQFAFVGLSRIRETNVFGGLPVAERHDELCCGVAVVDLVSGRSVAKFQFLTGVEEIFALDLIPGSAHPVFSGASLDDHAREVWVVPEGSDKLPVTLPRE
jgi:uncharacterized protein (TIGR03032 family)